MEPIVMALAVGGGLFVLFVLSGFFTVKQQTRAIIETFGKFSRVCGPGLKWRIPLIQTISGRITHRVRELEINVESKTKDDVFCDILIAVQFYVGESDELVRSAHYKLMNPQQQISSYVFDTVRALVPEMPVDHVFSEKEKIARAVKERLCDIMDEFGYTIMQALVNDIQPDSKVKEAMNHVNASSRLKDAAKNEAEAAKIRVIAAAEAEARAKELQGVGIARQRLAIAKGLKESVDVCGEAGISPEEASKMVLLTQHYDTVTAVGARSNSNIMMLPYAPDGMNNISDQIVQALMTTRDVGNGKTEKEAPAAPHGSRI